jgi:hypothetical protein
MMYVLRDPAGKVLAVSAAPPDSVISAKAKWEAVPDGHPLESSLRNSLSQQSESHPLCLPQNAEIADSQFRESDAGLIRVLEDLVDVLVERGVIRFTDLPPVAQRKLTERQNQRAELRKLTLLDDDQDSI